MAEYEVITINDLTEITSVTDTDIFHMYDNSLADRKLTAANLKLYCQNIDDLSEVSAFDATDRLLVSDSGTEKYSTIANLKSYFQNIDDLDALTSFSGSDAMLVSDAGTEKYATLSNLKTYFIDLNTLSTISTPASGDLILISDASDSNTEKAISFGNLEASITPYALDFSNITEQLSVASGDWFLIDRSGTNYKVSDSNTRAYFQDFSNLGTISTTPDTSYVKVQSSGGTLNRTTMANFRTSIVSGFTDGTDIFTTGNFYSTGGGNLGTTTNRFNYLYLDGRIYFYDGSGQYRISKSSSNDLYFINESNDYTKVYLSKFNDVVSADGECIITLERGATSANYETLNLYNSGNHTSGLLQMGLRVRSKGTGSFRDFVFSKVDDDTAIETDIMRIDTTNNAVLIGTDTFSIPSGNGLEVHNALGTSALRVSGTAGALDITFSASGNKAILNTASSGDTLVLQTQSTDRISIDDAGNITLTADAILQSSNYSSGVSGWRIDGDNATAEFTNIVARGVIETAVFKKNQISATAGNFVFANASILTNAITNSQTKIYVKEGVFSIGDRLRIKPDASSNELMKVTGTGSDSGGDYIDVTRNIDGLGAYAFNEGVAIVSMEDRVEVVTDATYAPYIDIVNRTGDTTEVVKSRFGYLDGLSETVAGVTVEGWGFWSDNAFLSGVVVAEQGTIGGFTLSSTTLENAAQTIILDSDDISVTVGSGSNIVKMKSGTGLWAGNSTFGSAPFRVTTGGALTATGATISGAITATSGTFTGTVNANAGTFTNVTISTGTIAGFSFSGSSITSTNFSLTSGATPSMTLGSGSSTVGIISSSGIWAGASSYGSAPLTIALDGTLTATGASIGGTINATAGTFTNVTFSTGTIASFTVSGTTITATNFYLNSATPQIYLGTSSSNRVGMSASGIWAGAADYASATAFKVSLAGALTATGVSISGAITATSGSFTGTVSTSNITATGGTIGGFSISSTQLTSGSNIILNGSTGAATFTNVTATGGTIGGFSLSSTQLTSGSNIILNGSTGAATFTNITATGGTIGGFSLSSTQLTSGSNIILNGSTGAATFTNITATGGSIGNWTLSSGSLTSTNFNLVNNGTASYIAVGVSALTSWTSYINQYGLTVYNGYANPLGITVGSASSGRLELSLSNCNRINIADETSTPEACATGDGVEHTDYSTGVISRIETRSIYVYSSSSSDVTDTGTHSFSGYCQHATISVCGITQYGTSSSGRPKARAFVTSISYDSGTNVTSVSWYLLASYSYAQAVLTMYGRADQ